MPHIYSTLSNDQIYNTFKKAVEGSTSARVPQRLKGITINGKANITNKQMQTPKGVATEVTVDELKHLESCGAFIKHKENGFICVEEKEITAEKAIEKNKLKSEDLSAPKKSKDFEQKVDGVTIKPVAKNK